MRGGRENKAEGLDRKGVRWGENREGEEKRGEGEIRDRDRERDEGERWERKNKGKRKEGDKIMKGEGEKREY